MIMLKVTKKRSFTLSLEDAFLEKHRGREGGVRVTPPPTLPQAKPSLLRVNLLEVNI